MKVVRTLPEDLENEALASYDKQGDQTLFKSKILLDSVEEGLQPPSGILDKSKRENFEYMFWYVFGYAIAKGWKRKGPFSE